MYFFFKYIKKNYQPIILYIYIYIYIHKIIKEYRQAIYLLISMLIAHKRDSEHNMETKAYRTPIQRFYAEKSVFITDTVKTRLLQHSFIAKFTYCKPGHSFIATPTAPTSFTQKHSARSRANR